MKAIWKYGLVPGRNAIYMPEHAELLFVRTQLGDPHVWAKVDTNADKVTRYVRVLATGEEFDDRGLRYIGTFFIADGSLVFHAFEEI